MVYAGLVEEACEIVATARARHDGERRNPWDEPECGNHYARSMAAWAVLLALTGFHFSAVEGAMSFAPRVNADDFRCFWSTPTAWGTYRQRITAGSFSAEIIAEYGELRLRRLELETPGFAAGGDPQITVAGERVSGSVNLSGESLVVELAEEAVITEGHALRVAAG
jgi:hypothetical protein